ncbi:hypothetical protein [Trichocoleus sp. DQ-U1]|uniref:hypothetical protein n=1 Tax=Trichocoleus sp. DQ-U1 TaxID=2933926 RepID=UPI0032995B2F
MSSADLSDRLNSYIAVGYPLTVTATPGLKQGWICKMPNGEIVRRQVAFALPPRYPYRQMRGD